MALCEVRAVLSFRTFEAGKIYQVDPDDSYYASLIQAGYLVLTNTFVEVTDELAADSDSAGMGSVPDAGVVEGKKRGRPKKAVNDGTGEHLPAEGERLLNPGDNATGSPGSEPDTSGRGEASP